MIVLGDKTKMGGVVYEVNSERIVLDETKHKPNNESEWIVLQIPKQSVPWDAIEQCFVLHTKDVVQPKEEADPKKARFELFVDRLNYLIGGFLATKLSDSPDIESMTQSIVIRLCNDQDIKKIVIGEMPGSTTGSTHDC